MHWPRVHFAATGAEPRQRCLQRGQHHSCTCRPGARRPISLRELAVHLARSRRATEAMGRGAHRPAPWAARSQRYFEEWEWGTPLATGLEGLAAAQHVPARPAMWPPWSAARTGRQGLSQRHTSVWRARECSAATTKARPAARLWAARLPFEVVGSSALRCKGAGFTGHEQCLVERDPCSRQQAVGRRQASVRRLAGASGQRFARSN